VKVRTVATTAAVERNRPDMVRKAFNF